MARPSIIAIDGPVAVGKSVVGSLLAQRLGFRFLDTGAMYRALTWLAIKRGVNPEDEAALSLLSASVGIDLYPPAQEHGGQCHVSIDGCDVTEEIRDPEVERAVSLVAKAAAVRQVLAAKQRSMAKGGRVVMAGRDIGTVVLPDADLKLYLAASPEERARRRYLELTSQGLTAQYGAILNELRRRDQIDSERTHSPLRPAEDAVIVDTDGLTLEDVLTKILALIGET